MIRSSLIANLIEANPGQLQEVLKNRSYRSHLRLRKTGLLNAVVVALQVDRVVGRSWRVKVPADERKRPAIVAFLNTENTAIQFSKIFYPLRFHDLHVRGPRAEEWLASGRDLDNAEDFVKVLELAKPAQPSG